HRPGAHVLNLHDALLPDHGRQGAGHRFGLGRSGYFEHFHLRRLLLRCVCVPPFSAHHGARTDIVQYIRCAPSFLLACTLITLSLSGAVYLPDARRTRRVAWPAACRYMTYLYISPGKYWFLPGLCKGFSLASFKHTSHGRNAAP